MQVSLARDRRRAACRRSRCRRSARERPADRRPPGARAAAARRRTAGFGRTGRRLAYSPRPLRIPSKPCSGRGPSLGRVPLRSAHRAQEHRVGLAAAASVSGGSAVPALSIAAPPISASLKRKHVPPPLTDRRQARASLCGDDLRADPVTGQDDYARCAAHRSGTLCALGRPSGGGSAEPPKSFSWAMVHHCLAATAIMCALAPSRAGSDSTRLIASSSTSTTIWIVQPMQVMPGKPSGRPLHPHQRNELEVCAQDLFFQPLWMVEVGGREPSRVASRIPTADRRERRARRSCGTPVLWRKPLAIPS